MIESTSDAATAPWQLGLHAAVQALQAKQLTATSLVESCLERIRGTNPIVNAFVWIDEVAALESAAAADVRRANGAPLSPFDGIPIGVKDNIDVMGMPTSNGISREAAATQDADLIDALRRVGLVFLGKLNMHEAALGTTTENPHFGTTVNPLSVSHSAGGSSGGSGAAVAAFMCPLTIGSDTMGSVRLPAASCAVSGWKPSRGAISSAGMRLLDPSLDIAGPLVRSGQDMALAMQIFGVVDDVEKSQQALRFSYIEEFMNAPNANNVMVRVKEFVASLDANPVSIPGFAPSPVRRAVLLGIEARLAQQWDDTYRAKLSPGLRSLVEYGDSLSPQRLRAARQLVEQSAADGLRVLRDNDVIITPASPVPPTLIGAEMVPEQADFLLLANIAGAPALSIPIALECARTRYAHRWVNLGSSCSGLSSRENLNPNNSILS